MGVILESTLRNPWRIDATGGALALPLIVTTDLVTIDRMEWTSSGAAANDEVEVLDSPPGVAAGSGRRLWASFASGADTWVYQFQRTVRPAQGICINQLTVALY